MSIPRVFIAYSHDSAEHIDHIRHLANTLRRDGVDADIDQYHLSPPEGWPHWVVNQIDTADFVILVCTEVFKRRFRGEDKDSIGLGVKWEGALLQESIFHDLDKFEAQRKRTKFIPVIFSHDDVQHIPLYFQAVTYYNLDTPNGYEYLYRRLTNQPRVQRLPIGKPFLLLPKIDIDQVKGLRVFLCHSSKDKPAVRNICKQLMPCGIKPWLDEENLLAGQVWRDEITKAIRSSDAVIVCLSPNAVTKAGYFHKEVKFALDVLDEQPEGAIFVVPIKLEECEIPERLGHIHCIKLFDSAGLNKLFLSLQSRAEQITSLSPVRKEPRIRAQTVSERDSPSNEVADEYPDAENLIRQRCQEKWPDDFEMRAYCEEKQRQALAKLRHPNRTDVPEDVFRMIREKAVREWPEDFEMQQYEEQKQLEAYQKLHGFGSV